MPEERLHLDLSENRIWNYTISGALCADDILTQHGKSLCAFPPRVLTNLCSFCSILVASPASDSLAHQPGYAALCRSAETCSLCRILRNTLVGNIPIGDIEKTAQRAKEEGWVLTPKQDQINISPLSQGRSNAATLRRFSVNWSISSHGGFEFRGDPLDKSPEALLLTDPQGVNCHSRLRHAYQWIKACESHEICDYRATSMPTRVLHIQRIEDGYQVAVYLTEGLQAPYIALSHRWGGGHPIKTTKESLAAHLADIPFDNLGQTFRDAIDVTYTLGFDFLWIDSLCIVQDDEEDWNREAATMCTVYRNAYMTIAASAAEGNQAGLWKPMIESYVGTHDGKPFAVRAACLHSRQVDRILETRAWALQEDFLSHRTLYFSSPLLSWRCRTMQASEDGLLDDLPQDSKSPWQLMRQRMMDSSAAGGREAYELWKQIAEVYSTLDITFERDRLIALSGITEHFRTLLDDEPRFGLWGKELISGLLWRVWGITKRSDVVRAPSWSWLSITGGIIYKNTPFRSFGDAVSGFVDECEADVLASGADMDGTILKLRGHCLEIRILVETENQFHGNRVVGIDQSGRDMGSGFLDHVAVGSTIPTTFVLLRTVLNHQDPANPVLRDRFAGLLLEKFDSSSRAFRRLGLSLLRSDHDSLTQTFAQVFPQAAVRELVVI